MRGWRPRGPRSSLQLAESMEARGFGSGPRTHVDPPRLSRGDWLVTVSAAAAVALFITATASGWAQPWAAYPALSAPAIAPTALFACALLFMPVLTWRLRR